jgi:hypothetical protein
VAGILIYFSVFTSLNGVNKYFEQSKHELVHFSENLESKEKKKIDSLVSFFDSQILTKKNENEFVNENLKNKLIVLKNDTDTTDLWSPKSKTNQGLILLLETQILTNNQNFTNFENHILETKEIALSKQTSLNEGFISEKINIESDKITHKGKVLWVLTAILESLCFLIHFLIHYFQYLVNKELKEPTKEPSKRTENKELQNNTFLVPTIVPTMLKKIGFDQNQNINFRGTGCANESEFVQKYEPLINEIKRGTNQNSLLTKQFSVNIATINCAKSFLKRL